MPVVFAIALPTPGEPDYYPRYADVARQAARIVVPGPLEYAQQKARELGVPIIAGGAADAWKMYEIMRERIADGTYDLDDDTFNLALFLSTSDAATLTGGTNDDLADLTNQHANANGYTTNGIALTTTWTRSGETLTWDYTNSPVWTASGGSIVCRFGVIFDDTHVSNGLMCMTTLDNTPADVTATDGNTLTVDAHASGVFTLTGAGA